MLPPTSKAFFRMSDRILEPSSLTASRFESSGAEMPRNALNSGSPMNQIVAETDRTEWHNFHIWMPTRCAGVWRATGA